MASSQALQELGLLSVSFAGFQRFSMLQPSQPQGFTLGTVPSLLSITVGQCSQGSQRRKSSSWQDTNNRSLVVPAPSGLGPKTKLVRDRGRRGLACTRTHGNCKTATSIAHPQSTADYPSSHSSDVKLCSPSRTTEARKVASVAVLAGVSRTAVSNSGPKPAPRCSSLWA